MKSGIKWLLLSLSVTAAGTGGYFLLRKSSAKLRGDIKSLLSASEATKVEPILNRMTRAELADTYQALKLHFSGVTIMPASLKQRMGLISQKYNIF